MPQENQLRKTLLYDKHVQKGAKMVPFSGWLMPLQYAGIIEEHFHTRSKASIFDTCHMGELFLKGKSSLAELERLVTCRVDDLYPGKCRYGFMLNDNGGVIDDLIIFKVSGEEYMIVVNAGTLEKNKKWIKSHIKSKDVEFIDDSEKIVKIDLQGPSSKNVVSSIFPGAGLESVKRFHFKDVPIKEFGGASLRASATGYTGEDGFEFFIDSSYGEKLWDTLLENPMVKPAGLGSRDSLRLEKGFSLYGHDLNEEKTPFEADLMKFVFTGKEFIGKEGLLKKSKNILSVKVGFICEGRRSAREGFKVIVNGKDSGIVTSGVFSPCLKKSVGLCYLDKSLAVLGNTIVLTDGKVEINAVISKPPFIK